MINDVFRVGKVMVRTNSIYGRDASLKFLRQHPEEAEQLLTVIANFQNGIRLTSEAREFLAERGFDPVYGARPLKRAIQRMILDPMAMEILDGRAPNGSVVTVKVESDTLRFETEVPRAA